MHVASLPSRSILVIAVGVFLGCASTPEREVEKLPDWFISPPTDPRYLFAAATDTSSDIQLAIDRAKTQAKNSLARQLEIRLGNLAKKLQEEADADEGSELPARLTSAIKVVAKQVLYGARTDQQKLIPEKGISRAYVLMSLVSYELDERLIKLLTDALKPFRDVYDNVHEVPTRKPLRPLPADP